MARPKLPTKEKIIRLLTSNPDKVYTYKELSAKVNSHPLAVGQIMKSLYKTEHKNLTEQVTHSNPDNKKRKVACIARYQTQDSNTLVESIESDTAIRIEN